MRDTCVIPHMAKWERKRVTTRNRKGDRGWGKRVKKKVIYNSLWPSGTEERSLCQHSKYTFCICHNSSLVLGRDLRTLQRLGEWIRKGAFCFAKCMF